MDFFVAFVGVGGISTTSAEDETGQYWMFIEVNWQISTDTN